MFIQMSNSCLEAILSREKFKVVSPKMEKELKDTEIIGICEFNISFSYVPPRENDFTVNKQLKCLVFDDAIDIIK